MGSRRWGFLLCFLALAASCKVFGLAESVGSAGTNAKAVHQLGEKGDGVNVGILTQDNLYDQHWAFFDKDANGNNTGSTHAFNLDFSGHGIDKWIHDTWMGGIIASRGSVSHPNDIGVAPGCDVYCARVINDACQISTTWIENALDDLTNNKGCRVISIGFALIPAQVPPDGQSKWTLLADYYAEEKNVVFVLGSGNSGNDIAVFGDMYNGIVVGGLAVSESNFFDRVGSSSSSGETEDDRRKPDVVAPSQDQTMPNSGTDTWKTYPLTGSDPEGATSLSGPHTAGVAALLYDLADDSNDTEDGHAEVIRAVIVNSAFGNIKDKQGDPTYPSDPNNIWHKDRGYGRIDALKAYELLSSAQVSAGGTITQDKGWAYATMNSTTQMDSYNIVGKKNHRLVITVTWNRKPTRDRDFPWQQWEYFDEAGTKFNLDLSIKDSNGVPLYIENDANNLEKVDITLPKDDVYTIDVNNPGTKSGRSYAMAYELRAPIVGDINYDHIVEEQDLAKMTGSWLTNDIDADIKSGDGVNLVDFALFGWNWRVFDPAYYVALD